MVVFAEQLRGMAFQVRLAEQIIDGMQFYQAAEIIEHLEQAGFPSVEQPDFLFEGCVACLSCGLTKVAQHMRQCVYMPPGACLFPGGIHCQLPVGGLDLPGIFPGGLCHQPAEL